MKGLQLIQSGRLLVLLGLLSSSAFGQVFGCEQEPIVASTPTPNFSNSADVMKCGNLEVGYGWARSWPGSGPMQDALSSSVGFGLAPFLDLHWNYDNMLRALDEQGPHYSQGDSWLAVQIRFRRQTPRAPALGFIYSVKVPSASRKMSFGTGYVDHSLALLVSKDFSKYHFDFNAVHTLAGGERGSSFSQILSLAASRQLYHNLGGIVEAYGGPQFSGQEFGSAFVALTYQVRPRLVLDAGIDTGFTGCAPHRRFVVGMTYAIANLYSHFGGTRVARANAQPPEEEKAH
jgi:hypothetical protein